MNCPLCRGESAEVAQAAVADLTWLYRARLALYVSGCFGSVSSLSLNRCQGCGLLFFTPEVVPAPELYANLQEQDRYHPPDRVEFLRAAPYTAGRRVLDVGSGNGAACASLGALEYVGLETNAAAVRSATAMGRDVRFQTVQDHAAERPGYYDAVCAFQVLEHVPDPRSFIQSCLTLLCEKGLLILSVPAQDSFISALPNNALNLPPHHLTLWPDSSMREVGRIWNLEVVELEAEVLEAMHRRWYAAHLCRTALCSTVGLQPRPVVDRRLVFRAIESLGWRLSWFLVVGRVVPRGLPRGHTLTAVFRKENQPVERSDARGG